jgi:hypothetical protein
MADDVILTHKETGNTKQVPASQADVYKGRGWVEEGGGPVSQRKPAKRVGKKSKDEDAEAELPVEEEGSSE